MGTLTSTPVGAAGAQITGMNPALFGQNADVPLGAAGLSPDALIAFVQMNLSDTDNQVQQLMSTMNSNKDAIAAFQKLSSLIRGMKGQKHDAQAGNVIEMEDLAKQCGLTVTRDKDGKMTADIPSTCKFPHAQQLADALNEEFSAWHKHDGNAPDPKLRGSTRPSDALESEAAGVDAIANKLSSGSEITMLKLQSLVQERTRIIQFASNVVGALNEGMKTEVNNIRA